MTFWTKLQKFPPILIRLLARHKNGRPLTIDEISQRAGMPRLKVIALSESTSWDGVDVYVVHAFTKACGIDLCSFKDTNRCLCYLRGSMRGGTRRSPQFSYLRKSPWWASEFELLIQKWLKTRQLK